MDIAPREKNKHKHNNLGKEITVSSPSNMMVYTKTVARAGGSDSNMSDEDNNSYYNGISRVKRHDDTLDDEFSDELFSDEDEGQFPSAPKRHRGEHYSRYHSSSTHRHCDDRDRYRDRSYSRSSHHSPVSRRETPEEIHIRKEKEEAFLKETEKSKLNQLRPTSKTEHSAPLNIPLNCYDDEFFHSIAHIDDQLVKKNREG